MMTRTVRFLDLSVNETDRVALLDAMERVLDHGRILVGPEVQDLEERVAARCGRRFVVGVGSGTDALILGLKALGVGLGDEVLTTSLAWRATPTAIAYVGASPVFADIRDDLNIDPDSVARLISPRTRAILPVHYTGKVCDMEPLIRLAEEHGLLLVEDVSQAFDARYRGRIAGSFGDVACFSMNPMKIFAACGEAGMVATDSEDVYDKLIALRYNGTVNREVCIEPSFNGRLDTLQAAVLLQRLDGVEAIVQRRREIAARYNGLLGGMVGVPDETEGDWDVYYTYTIRAPRRDELKAYLEASGIETKIQHPYLMFQQPAYKDGATYDAANAERLLQEILCIPANEKLADQDVDYVAARIRDFYEGAA